MEEQYIHIIKRTSIVRLLALLSLTYIIILFFISPLYKFLELYYEYQYINFSLIRSVVVLLVLFVLLIHLSEVVRKQKFSKAFLLLFPGITCLILIAGIFLVSYFRVLDYSTDSLEIFLYRVDSVLFGYSMLFIAGVFLDVLDIYKVSKLFFILWFLFSLFIFINAKLLIASFFVYTERPEKIINYIFLSNGYLFFSFFALVYVKKRFYIVFVWIITVLCMFLMPSRSNQISFLFATLLPFFIYTKKYGFILLVLVISLVLGSFVLFHSSFKFFSVLDNELIGNARIFNTDLSNDTSLHARLENAQINLDNFKKSWFFGDFMGDIRIFKEDGNETHSYFSFWEQFGLIPFLLLVWSVLNLLFFLLRLRSDVSVVYSSTLMLTLFFVPLMIFAKGFTSNLIWFMMPRIVMYYYAQKKLGNV